MKIAIYLHYFFRSVALRGFFNTLALIFSELYYERKFGIKTSAIKKSDSQEFYHYQGGIYRVMLRVFRELHPLTKHCEFIDIGCGKGRAVYIAEYCGYQQLTGIEMDLELVRDAQANLQLYPFKKSNSEITFVHTNALEYAYRNKPSVYFLFNPFSEKIMEEVLESIVRSTLSETWFVYMNPQYPGPFRRKEIEEVKKFKTRFYTEAVLFRLKPQTSS